MTVDFTDYFWGERHEGYSVLYGNMKNGATAAKELADMLRELAKSQDDATKAHAKIVKQLSTSGHCGSFGPLLVAFKTSAEKAAHAFNACHLKVAEVARDVSRYQEDLLRKHKRVKEEEASTLEAVKAIQETTGLLHKSKENYKQRLLEVEKLRRDNAAGPKDIEKAETKFKKAQEEYKALVDKYCIIREAFQSKFVECARRFQQHETEHLESMRKFVEKYLEIADDGNRQWSRIHGELQISIAGLTTAHLLEQFALAKYTGLEKPGPIEYEDEKLSTSATGPPSDISDRSANSADKLSLGGGSLGAVSANSGSGVPSSAGAMRKESSGSGKGYEHHHHHLHHHQPGSRLRSWSAKSAGGTLPAAPTSGSFVAKRDGLRLEASYFPAAPAGSESPAAGSHQQAAPAAASTPTPSKISARASSLLNLFVTSGANNSNASGAVASSQQGSKRKSPSEPPSPTNAEMPHMPALVPATSEGWRGSKSAACLSVPPVTQPTTLTTTTTTTSSPIPSEDPPHSQQQPEEKLSSASEGEEITTEHSQSKVHDSTSEQADCSIVIEKGKKVCEEEHAEGLRRPSASSTPVRKTKEQHQHPAASPKQSPKITSPYATISGWTGFLRRRPKKKDSSSKKKGSEGDADSLKGQSENEGIGGSTQPDVDEEGFSKQPPSGGPRTASDPWADFNQEGKNFYSSSDESDEDTKKKIKVEIKPKVANGSNTISASVDELRTAVGGLELVPPPPSRMRPQSAMNDRIIGVGSQTMKLKHKAKLNDTILDPLDPAANSSAALRRSHSQSHVNRPSADILGLVLHPIENIDSEPVKNTEQEEIRESAINLTDATVPLSESSNATLDVSAASATSKEIRDIFNNISELSSASQSSVGVQPALPPKTSTSDQSASSMARERITNSLIALPRPPSRHGTALLSSSKLRSSPSPGPTTVFGGEAKLSLSKQNTMPGSIDRANSSSPSADLNQTSNLISTLPRSGFGTSRGPSPLTLGMSEVVPLAVAFQEVCHACFRGTEESMCQVRLIGDMMVSFPAGIVNVLTNNINPAPLRFRIKNATVLESVIPNKHLISQVVTLSTNEVTTFEFNMAHLKELLKKQSEQNSNASYFNIDILKYQIRTKGGASSCPLQMVAYWKCTPEHTDLRLDYKYNSHSMAVASPLLNLSIAVPIDGGVKNMQSKPNGVWIPESNRALWKFPELSQSAAATSLGSLRARFELTNGPGCQGTIAAQFNCEGTTLSGVEFELVGAGYRVSLVKKRFVSGKYVCDADASAENRHRYAAPPATSSDD